MRHVPPRAGRSAAQAPAAHPPGHSPHAALLIDFDNVTLGIRSDLTKELRTLLDSDIIKGKVAVQRAYADWRRYPQYIVPLSESSIDLIFAPAFGTNKKNATDIRLAVDAMELVFTRPEIGTFILLSGDSDFSSLVIKLKEYGRYVIGVGIRESASDLLIQNCDEYYSYSDLTGLTREEEAQSAQQDPWALVVEAVAQMARNDDVMRSDRLKQVMQGIDANFDEKNAGFNRFSKFVTEAGNRGLIRVSKLDNGQFEVGPADGARTARAEAAPAKAPAKAPAGRARQEPARAEPAAGAKEEKDNGRRRRGRRGRGGGGRDRDGAAATAEPRERKPEAGTAPMTLAEAFQLMQRALGELEPGVAHDKLRARMVALLGREDPLLEPGRFHRLLRQANDAEIADVRKTGDDAYEVSQHRIQIALALREEAAERLRTGRTAVDEADEPEAEDEAAGPGAEDEEAGEDEEPAAPRRGGIRFRRGSRGPTLRATEVPLVGAVQVEGEGAPGAKAAPGPKRARKRSKPAAKTAGPAETGTPAPDSGAGDPAGEAEAPAPKRPRRRRSRGKPREKPAE